MLLFGCSDNKTDIIVASLTTGDLRLIKFIFSRIEIKTEIIWFACRNYPKGTINDMVEDVSQPCLINMIYVIGQSVGAHISSCVLF